MKNFKRKIFYPDGHDAYEYDDYGELKFVQCCEDGWISLTDLEPNPESFGAIQVIREWKATKVINNVDAIARCDFVHPEKELMLDVWSYQFESKGTPEKDAWVIRRWQPLAALPKGERV